MLLRFLISFIFILFVPLTFAAETSPGVPVRTGAMMVARPENTLFHSPLNRFLQVQEQKKTTGLMKYYESFAADNPSSDLNNDGVINKLDIFYYAQFWMRQEQPVPGLDELTWNSRRGGWQVGDVTVFGNTDLDARLVSEQPLPIRIGIEAEVELRAGTSAGVMFWADGSGETGFTVRIDTQLNALALSRIGPWAEEERLDFFPITITDGNTFIVRIVTGNNSIRVYLPGKGDDPALSARNVTPMGDRLGWYLQDAEGAFRLLALDHAFEPDLLAYLPDEGEYQHIFDQAVGEPEGWYINDHCFIKDRDGLWHLFGITNTAPIIPFDEDQFAHATSTELLVTPWQKHPYALVTDETQGEAHLWAPYIIEKDGVYYMFYCAGSRVSSYQYRIHLATSTDLFNWTRYENNPLFMDYYDARDPMIIEADGQYIMYYTANADRPVGNHVVAYRTSADLLNWSPRRIAFSHETAGTYGGPTESPYVVKYGDYYYLFIGPEYLNTTPDEDYRRTAIYRSTTPYHWDRADRVTSIRSHAAEVVQDEDGAWYASHGGWFYNGVFLAPLEWKKEPSVQVFLNLGESFDYITGNRNTFVSDWRGTQGFDLVADFDGFFTLEIPVSSTAENVIIEFEEEGETVLELLSENGTQTLLDEGNTGPGFVTIHQFEIPRERVINNTFRLRFRDADPTDGWGPNVNWLRVLW